jgi:uncharacterized protein (DUF952 family)
VLFHIAERQRWEAAAAQGRYTGSTLGKDLADEGFIHLSRADQVAGVGRAFYAGIDGLVLLHVDPAALVDPVIDEVVGTAADGTPLAFPHLYGPIPVTAVVAVEPFDATTFDPTTLSAPEA